LKLIEGRFGCESAFYFFSEIRVLPKNCGFYLGFRAITFVPLDASDTLVTERLGKSMVRVSFPAESSFHFLTIFNQLGATAVWLG
jgi:hypothetical protein